MFRPDRPSSRGVAGTESTMSKLNIGLAIAVVFLAIGGVYVAGKVATKRNEIAAQIVAEKKKRDENIDQLAKVKITRQTELSELNRLQFDWGNQWTAKGATDPKQGQVLLNIGQASGLGARPANRPPEPVHVFAVMAEGTQYLGEFTVQGDAQRTLLTLNRKPFPGELEKWPADGEFRVRQRIPPGVRATFHDLATNLTIAEQIVINETAKSQIQDNHIAASQKTLDRRLAELNGDPAAPQNADREITSGLVETLRVEEAQRNAVLKAVDALRRELSDRYAQLVRVLAENKQAVDARATGTETAARPARDAN